MKPKTLPREYPKNFGASLRWWKNNWSDLNIIRKSTYWQHNMWFAVIIGAYWTFLLLLLLILSHVREYFIWKCLTLTTMQLDPTHKQIHVLEIIKTPKHRLNEINPGPLFSQTIAFFMSHIPCDSYTHMHKYLSCIYVAHLPELFHLQRYVSRQLIITNPQIILQNSKRNEME